MPGCDTGRNVQKYRGGGGGASTLQEALENGNISTLAIELQSSGLFIGDGGGLSNIAGVGGSVGNMQQVTTSGATTSNKIILTNTNESLQASGNINVGNNKFYLGDGGLLSNTAGTVTLQQASNQGNVVNNTVSFTNAAESIVTTGNVIVSTNVHATEFFGDGTTLTGIALSTDMTSNAARVSSLESSVTTNTGDITSLETDMTSNAARVSSLETDMTSNASRITITETDITSNAARVSSLESSVTTNTSDITSLETNMTSNASRVSSLETDMTSNASRITTTETDMTSNAARVSSLESSVTTNTSDITSLETDMTSNASRISSLETDMTSNASRVSSLESETQPVGRGGTGNTFSSASKSDLLVGTSGGTFATLSIPSSSASGKILKIDGSNNLYWGADNTSSGGGGGGSGVLSLGSTFMKYASGTDYDTSTGETINLEASINDLASNIVVRDANKNINVTKVTLGSNTLTETEYSGKSSTVTIGTDNSGTERDLAFVDGNSILKDNGGKLKWKPNSGELYIGPSGSRNTLTNVLWTGKSAKVTINNTTGSSVAAPVLIHEADGIVRKDTSNRLTWTATGTHAGTLTIGTISGDHSNITASTFTGESANVKITTNTSSTPLNIALTKETDSNTHIVKDTDGDFTYKPDDGTLKIKSGTLESIITPSTFSGESANVKVTEHTSDTNLNIALIKETVSNTHIVRDTDGEFKYNPHSGTVTATIFSGNGSGLDYLNFEAANNSGKVPVEHGGTGKNTLSANHILIGNGTNSINTIAPESSSTAKFLSSYSNGNLTWTSPSVSQISIGDDTTSTSNQPILYANDHGTQDIESDKDTLHYKRLTGTLTTSNLITSGTSQFNGIANTDPEHTLSVGTVFSIQEWNGSGTPIDVMVVRKGNAYFEGNVYVGKTLTIPTVLQADTIKVRSHNVSGTTVINERKASVQRID